MLLSQHQMTMKTLRVYPLSFSLFCFSILRRRLLSWCISRIDHYATNVMVLVIKNQFLKSSFIFNPQKKNGRSLEIVCHFPNFLVG